MLNRIVNLGIRVLFRHGYNDTTNAFKAYRREVIETVQPLLSNHFNLTVELPLKAIVRGHSFTVVPISWTNRTAGTSKLKLQEMGSRYLFIVLYVFLEHHLSRGDYRRAGAPARNARPRRRGGREGRRPVSAGETAAPDVPDMDLDDVYGRRFSDAEARTKDQIWSEIAVSCSARSTPRALSSTSRATAATSSATSRPARSGRRTSATCRSTCRPTFASSRATASGSRSTFRRATSTSSS